MSILVETQPRKELGKNASRRLRAQGLIPAVLYGRDTESVPLSVDPREIIKVLRSESGRNTIFQLSVGKKKRDVLIRDYQIHPTRDSLIHTDFQTIAMDQKMNFDVPIEVVGSSIGVQGGGVLELILREISVNCLPADVPDNIQVDVSGLDINETLHISELQIDRDKIEVLNDPEIVVLLVAPPTVVPQEEPEAEIVAEAEEGAQPEVIKRGKEEEEGQEE